MNPNLAPSGAVNLDAVQLENVVTAGQAAALARHVAQLLNRRGIEPAPLKSVLLNATIHSRGAPALMGDVDLLVDPAEFSLAQSALSADGGERISVQRHASTWRLEQSPLLLDLHCHVVDPAWFRYQTSAVLARARTSETLFAPARVRMLDPYDVYTHLVADFAKSRRGLRQTGRLRDLAAWARANRLSAVELARWLDVAGVARAARYVLGLASTFEGDRFATTVLASLPADPVGQVAAGAATRLMAWGGEHWTKTPVGHALNTTLGRGVGSLLRSVTSRS